MRFIAALALALLACQSHAAGRVFFDDFEAGTGKWVQDGARNKCVAVAKSIDGVAVHGGTAMAECNWNGNVAWNAGDSYSTLRLNSWSYTSEFLVRLWVRYAADVDRRPGGKLLRLDPNDGKQSFYLAGQMENTVGDLFIYWELVNGAPGPLFWGDGSAFGDGKWHKIEIYTGNGVVKVWQDGKLKQQGSARASGKWYPLYLMSNWSNNPGWEHDAANHVYWDDVEIFSDAGTGATGLMADATISDGGTPPVPVPVPTPTVLSTIGGDVFIASPNYTVFSWKNGTKVGTIAPGVKCDSARRIAATDFYRVPTASTAITWSGTKRSDYVVAACRGP